MDFLKSWIVNITVISIIISIITSIAPKSNLEKIVKFSASGLLLLCFISPFFTDFNIDFSNALVIDTSDSSSYSLDFDKTSLEYSKTQCENYIRKKLNENDIETEKINMEISKKDDSLIINRIYITTKNAEKAKNILIKDLKIDEKVIFIDGVE